MPVGPRALDRQGRLGGHEALAFEHPSQRLDVLGRPVGDIGQGALTDLLAFAPALAQQDRRTGVAVRDDLDVIGNQDIAYTSLLQARMCNLHGNDIAPRRHPSCSRTQAVTAKYPRVLNVNYFVRSATTTLAARRAGDSWVVRRARDWPLR